MRRIVSTIAAALLLLPTAAGAGSTPPPPAARELSPQLSEALNSFLQGLEETGVGRPAGGAILVAELASSDGLSDGQMLGSLLLGKGVVVSLAGTYYAIGARQALKTGARGARRAFLVSSSVAILGYLEIAAGLLLLSTHDARAAVLAPALPETHYLARHDFDCTLFDGRTPSNGRVGSNGRLADLYGRLDRLAATDLLELDRRAADLFAAGAVFQDYFLLRGYILSILETRGAAPQEEISRARQELEGQLARLEWGDGTTVLRDLAAVRAATHTPAAAEEDSDPRCYPLDRGPRRTPELNLDLLLLGSD